jgi:hypothetical protein
MYSNIKFMHSYHFKQLPFSFTGVWQTNAERNPARQLRNAYDLFVPAHRVEFVNKASIICFSDHMEYCTRRQIQSQDNNVYERSEKSSAVRFVKCTSLFAVLPPPPKTHLMYKSPLLNPILTLCCCATRLTLTGEIQSQPSLSWPSFLS